MLSFPQTVCHMHGPARLRHQSRYSVQYMVYGIFRVKTHVDVEKNAVCPFYYNLSLAISR